MRLFFSILSFVFFPLLVNAQAKKGLSSFLPNQAKLQFAGGIGFLSAGFGYESHTRKLQGDFYYGYVPKKYGGITIHSLTAKLTWIPMACQFNKNLRVDLVSAGFLVNYVFGKQYFLFSPQNYPYSYYRFPTAMHTGLFIGEGIRYKKIGAYYEIGTTDRELLSYIDNIESLKFTDILNIAIGIRFSLK